MGIKNLMNKSFATRTASGIVLVLLLLLFGILGGYPLYTFCLVLSLVGVHEMLGVLKLQETMLGYTAYILTTVYYITMNIFFTEFSELVILACLIIILAVYVFTYPRYRTEEVLLSFFSVIYAGVLLSYVWMVRSYNTDGIFMIWLIFLCSWGSDTCAYLAGVMFGKHKMTPVLSPKKTIEGAVGGVAGAILLGALYGFVFQEKIVYFEHPELICGIICGVGALISMVGDLAASAIKRNYEIKDYGKLIPGHGGVLDRFDSVLFTAPVIYYCIYFLG